MKKRLLVLTLGVFLFFAGFAQIPAGYYDQATEKSGEILRAALRDITTTGHVKIPYTSTSFDIWDAYAITDVRPAPDNLIIWDMYSDIPGGSPAYTFTIYTNQCGTASAEGGCYAREHCMPNSWWGGIDDAANPQYSDLHHLFPADQYVNNEKSANIIGETSSPIWTSTNGSKLGPCSYPGYTGIVFEPINEYKGDFARAYFYLAARYMDRLSTWVNTYPNTNSKYVINTTGGNYKQWFIDMLLSWNSGDPVSQKEIDRNNNIYYNTPQHNRNPFIDHPEYICQMWSCSSSPVISNIVHTPFSPLSTNAVSVSANATDNVSLTGVTLQWCTDGTGFGNSILMNIISAPKYMTVSPIPAQPAGTVVTYRILATDNEGNTTTSFTNSYRVNKDEPSAYPPLFSCGTSTATSISLIWTDATDAIIPDGYVIKASSVGLAAIPDPVDGIVEVTSPYVKNVAQGIQTVNFNGLPSSTTYFFRIFPYTNPTSGINFKTSATAPDISCATTIGGTGSCASDLLISEYIEGSSNNKYIEISNNTGAAVNLSNYKLQTYTNGSATPSYNNTLSGTLNDHSTMVYKNTSATVYAGAATANTAINFNGDDAVALFKISTNTFVDIFGRIGERPSTAWTSGSFTTVDKTLVRNSSVTSGITVNPVSGFPTLATEWTQYPIDVVSYLGSHTMACATCASPTVQAGNITFSSVSQTAMTINWTNGDGANRIVVMSQGNPVADTPLYGTTYIANPVFGTGNEMGPDEFVVYNNSGSSVTVSNLIADQTYYISVFEYNCLPASEIYLSPPASSSQVASDMLPANSGTISGPAIVCQGQNSVSYSVPAINYATSYIWTLPAGATGTSTTNEITVNFDESAVSGNITVKGTNAFGNGTASVKGVSVNTTVAAPVIVSIIQPICIAATGSIELSNLPSGNWIINPGAIHGSTPNATISDLATGYYYSYTVTNTSGCTSPQSESVFINGQTISPPTPVITRDGNVLHSDAIVGNQWYKQTGLISDATNQQYTATSDGDYYVIVTSEGCNSDISNIIDVVTTGLESEITSNTIKVSPNPFINEFTIEIKGAIRKANFQLINSLGDVVLKGTVLDKTVIQTSGLSAGIYLLKLENGNTFVFKKIIKVK